MRTIMALTLALAFASCGKQEQDATNPDPKNYTNEVSLSLASEAITTRTFFDPTNTTET